MICGLELKLVDKKYNVLSSFTLMQRMAACLAS